jgi:hypothetical protein
MFKLKFHMNSNYDKRIRWVCPHCAGNEVVLVIFPKICTFCRRLIPDIGKLKDTQTYRINYHFSKRNENVKAKI